MTRLNRYGDPLPVDDDDDVDQVTPIRQRHTAPARIEELRRILREAKARREARQ